MSNEENIKKESVEEMTEKLAEVLAEESEDSESEVTEEVSEASEPEVTEEAPEEAEPEVAEEVSEEPTEESVEETPSEENESEERGAEPMAETEKKPFWKKWLGLIIAVAVLAVLAIGYFAVASHYSDRLLMKTTVNGTDCAGMTIKEVEAWIQKQVEEYTLTISGKNDITETIDGTEIGIKYIGYNQLKEAFEEQNEYSWPKAMFQTNDIYVEIVFEYSQEKLDAKIAELQCMKPENQIAPVAATVVLKENQFEIQDEVYGTQIDTAKLTEVVHASVKAVDTTVNLNTDGCYVQPKYTKKSPEVLAAKDAMNKCLDTEVSYSLDGLEMKIDKSTFAPWISVNENMELVVSTSEADAFVKKVAAKYNTANRSGVLVTPKGKSVELANASLGRAVGTEAERNQLIEEIKAGKTVERKPVIAREAMGDGQFVWGNTYIEVDITEQHMWYIQNGTVVFESDVVTGVPNPSKATPTGIYTILEKMRNKVLKGNIMPNGKREYETPVAYWARVTWSGIGFHDATWQPAFGGQLYKQGYGSHGCINMPLQAVRTFYDMISVGTPVVIHN